MTERGKGKAPRKTTPYRYVPVEAGVIGGDGHPLVTKIIPEIDPKEPKPEVPNSVEKPSED